MYFSSGRARHAHLLQCHPPYTSTNTPPPSPAWNTLRLTYSQVVDWVVLLCRIIATQDDRRQTFIVHFCILNSLIFNFKDAIITLNAALHIEADDGVAAGTDLHNDAAVHLDGQLQIHCINTIKTQKVH